MTRTPIPSYAVDNSKYPECATTLAHLSLPFYCCNCQRKRNTTYLTPDFGPFCDACLSELIREFSSKIDEALVPGDEGNGDALCYNLIHRLILGDDAQYDYKAFQDDEIEGWKS